jgi:hypothetical protein
LEAKEVGVKLQATEVKDTLKSLISEASSIDPKLEKRLDEIYRWIKDKQDGSLNTKKGVFVLDFLNQLVYDSDIWLKGQKMPLEQQQIFFDSFVPTQRYWYGFLFSQWLEMSDQKSYLWKKELMSGKFQQDDGTVIKSIICEIYKRQGTEALRPCRLIADLSMATDLIVSGTQGKPVCVQITRTDLKYTHEKYEKWKETLDDWGIDRGVFISYNPSTKDYINRLVNIMLYYSNTLPPGRYSLPLST